MRALQVDYGRGELHRSAVAAPTLAELAGDYVAHLETRVGDRSTCCSRTCPTRFRPVAAACAFAGLRVSEALGLRWRDVDLTAYTLTVSGQLGRRGERVPLKTAASAATVRLLPAVERELRAHRSRQAARNLRLVHADALVFVTATGKPQSPRNVLRAVHKAGADAGLNGGGRERVGLHDLRHSYVAGTFAAGASLAEVAALARHANARVTAQVYAGLTENGRETAAAKLLESGFGR